MLLMLLRLKFVTISTITLCKITQKLTVGDIVFQKIPNEEKRLTCEIRLERIFPAFL